MAVAASLAACVLRSVLIRNPGTTEAELGPVAGLPTDHYRGWDIAMVLFLFLMFGGQLLPMPAQPDTPPPVTSDRILASVMLLFLLAGFTTAFVSFRLGPVDWLGLRWKKWRSVLWIAPVSLMAIWGVFGLLIWGGYEEWMKSIGVDTMQDSVRTLRESDNPSILGAMCFAALVAAPLCEEVIFRGYCYPALKKFAGAKVSMITTSLVFACAHGNLTSALPLFLLGLLLVFVYERTRSLWAPIAIHFLFNAATVAMLIRSRWLNTPYEFP
jgi:membrane protease YdiL (CAAX protease family)